MFPKVSLVAASISMRAGRSVRAHTIPESVDMSPDCTPCVTSGRLDDQTRAGALILVENVAAAEARVVRNRRRVIALPARKRRGMKWSPPNHYGGCPPNLTVRG